ncbi:MAG: DNA repair protein RecO [Christensenella sp.]
MEKHYCIVLRTTDYKDNDRILTLFSRTDGRIDAQARGVRKIKSENTTASQPMSCGEYEFYKKGDRLFLTHALIKQEFYNVQNDYDKYAAACVMLELTDKILQNTDEYEDLFLALIHALFAMEQDTLCRAHALAYFFARVVGRMGIFPSIGECAVCGSETSGATALFSMEEGGEICAQCAPHIKTVNIPRSALITLAGLAATRPQDIVKTGRENTDDMSIVSLMAEYLENMMELHLKTMKCFR